MAALELHDIEGPISSDAIQKAIEGLESPQQKVKDTGYFIVPSPS